jgi:hypothetical protein
MLFLFNLVMVACVGIRQPGKLFSPMPIALALE